MIEPASIDHDIARTVDLLGGQTVLRHPVRTNIEVHDLLQIGLPSAALLHLVDVVFFLSSENLFDKAFGISVRTLQRRKKDPEAAHLNIEQSDRTWRFAEIFGRAIHIFGSKEAAETWMTQPASGLDYRRPIDLISTAVGLEAVQDYLTRIDYGVYT